MAPSFQMASIHRKAVAHFSPKDFDFKNYREVGTGGQARVLRVIFGGKEDDRKDVAVKVPFWNDSTTEEEVSSHEGQECLSMSERKGGLSRVFGDILIQLKQSLHKKSAPYVARIINHY